MITIFFRMMSVLFKCMVRKMWGGSAPGRVWPTPQYREKDGVSITGGWPGRPSGFAAGSAPSLRKSNYPACVDS